MIRSCHKIKLYTEFVLAPHRTISLLGVNFTDEMLKQVQHDNYVL